MDEQASFLKAFLAYESRLRAYFIAATGDSAEADDLVQETAVILWRKFDQYDPARSFLSWMMGVARLEVLKWRQKQARSRLVLSEESMTLLAESASAEEANPDSRLPSLRRCIGRLSDMSRELLMLRYDGRNAVRAIADQVGKTPGAVSVQLSRIRDFLRRCIEREEECMEDAV